MTAFTRIKQAKGLQHCRDIKRDAMNFYWLTGGNTQDMRVCIKMALDDHVKMLQQDVAAMEKLRKEMEAPTPVRGEDPF